MNINKKLREQRVTLDELVKENYSDFNYLNALKQYMIIHANYYLSEIYESGEKKPEAIVLDYAISVLFPELINLINNEKVPRLSTSYGKVDIKFGEVPNFPYYKFQY